MEIPEHYRKFAVDTSRTLIDGNIYEYAIIQSEYTPEIPSFVSFEEGKFLFISEGVPIRYRRHFLTHEVRESKMKGQPGSCLTALKWELDEVPENLLSAYRVFRYEFFQSMLLYYSRFDGNEQLMKNLKESYDYLKEKVLG